MELKQKEGAIWLPLFVLNDKFMRIFTCGELPHAIHHLQEFTTQKEQYD